MILSAQQLFSDNQAVVATALSTNVIDTGVRGTAFGAKAAFTGDTGKGNPIPVLIQVTETFNTLTSLTVALETGDVAGTLGNVLNTQSILLADLVAGKQTFMQFLPNGVVGRYLGVRYTVVGDDPTVGAVTAGISMGNQTNLTGV